MSRVAKGIDNGLMEGFWGILKRERCYGKRFTDKETRNLLTSRIKNCQQILSAGRKIVYFSNYIGKVIWRYIANNTRIVFPHAGT